jgi:uncharacterized protein (DUF433 family)
MPITTYPHIELRADGAAYIDGSQTKVVEIVMARLAYNWDADEIHRQQPHLSLAQIYSALAYYHDNQAEIDADIERRLQREQHILGSLKDSPLRLKLQAAKRERLSGPG